MLNHMKILAVAVVVALGIGGGCAVEHSSPQRLNAQAAPCAQCLVCKKNADMACIDVQVDAKTPFTDYGGKRYYFCSDECRKEFTLNPEKYVGVK